MPCMLRRFPSASKEASFLDICLLFSGAAGKSNFSNLSKNSPSVSH